MSSIPLVSTDRQARDLEAEIDKISLALSSDQTLKSIIEGLPELAIEGIRRSLTTEKRELTEKLEAFRLAQEGNTALMQEQVGNDLGDLLIVARLAQNWKQKDLARKLGRQEQSIQRWESERYRSISLGNFMKVARALSVEFSAQFQPSHMAKWLPPPDLSQAEVQKVLKHARTHNWFEDQDSDQEDRSKRLIRYVSEHVTRYGTPSLLRTGINVKDHSEDWVLLSWKAQVTRCAERIIDSEQLSYRPLDVSWLRQLAKLSANAEGPLQAQTLLKKHGIVLIIERNIPGMEVDGAAFLVESIPVIGLTLRRDALDNFWFTLMHEVAHVILHYKTGLASGFFDDVEHAEVDEFEQEANKFASDLLVPEELWSRTPARIAKTSAPIENLAKQLNIAPAIIFGRIRFERKNYTIFSDKIGRGTVRKLFLPEVKDE
ncbi:XRE family transcriptional regulator [Polaromonas jejuensis]|uniref:ImmA/IrrE family metallo-endopeptidase n=1 Tax=Polaromonas jejuensis TaxID=457502 RepID=A0ABW0Q737_9BURK|nr:XRE family transcriptional regulator [Polaromonas jejuensis]